MGEGRLSYDELLKIAFGVINGRTFAQSRKICGITEDQFCRLREQRGGEKWVGEQGQKWIIANKMLNIAREIAGKPTVPAEMNPYIKETE